MSNFLDDLLKNAGGTIFDQGSGGGPTGLSGPFPNAAQQQPTQSPMGMPQQGAPQQGQEGGIWDKLMGGVSSVASNPMAQYLAAMGLARALGFKKNPMALTPIVGAMRTEAARREQAQAEQEQYKDKLRLDEYGAKTSRMHGEAAQGNLTQRKLEKEAGAASAKLDRWDKITDNAVKEQWPIPTLQSRLAHEGASAQDIRERLERLRSGLNQTIVVKQEDLTQTDKLGPGTFRTTPAELEDLKYKRNLVLATQHKMDMDRAALLQPDFKNLPPLAKKHAYESILTDALNDAKTPQEKARLQVMLTDARNDINTETTRSTDSEKLLSAQFLMQGVSQAETEIGRLRVAMTDPSLIMGFDMMVKQIVALQTRIDRYNALIKEYAPGLSAVLGRDVQTTKRDASGKLVLE